MKKYSVLLVGIFALIVSVQSYLLFTPIVTTEPGVVFELKPNVPPRALLSALKAQHVIRFPLFYRLFIYLQPKTVLKSGEYLFRKGSTFVSIWKQLKTGKGQIYYPFMIVPGWTFKDIRQALTSASWAMHSNQPLSDQQVMAQLGSPMLAAEGEFFPETYYFTKGTSDITVLKRAFKLMQKKLQDAWEHRAGDLPYQTAYEALIAASLIEKEAHLSSERPIIAGVLVNRLRKHMLLQFDPTVIYGMGDYYTGKIRKDDLKMDTPYNTYLHKGLPPTPIAMPSFASIEAALHPESHNYYYFVAKGNGAHQFSKSLQEHNSAVKAYKPQAFYFNHLKIENLIQHIYLDRVREHV